MVVPFAENPRRAPTLVQWIVEQDRAEPKAACFCFTNVFFPMKYPDAAGAKSKLPSLSKNIRIKSTAKGRTKCILKPERVGAAGIHSATPANANFKHVTVPQGSAIMHHYRASDKTVVFDNDLLAEMSHDNALIVQYQAKMLNHPFYQAMRDYVESDL